MIKDAIVLLVGGLAVLVVAVHADVRQDPRVVISMRYAHNASGPLKLLSLIAGALVLVGAASLPQSWGDWRILAALAIWVAGPALVVVPHNIRARRSVATEHDAQPVRRG